MSGLEIEGCRKRRWAASQDNSPRWPLEKYHLPVGAIE
jgi:hypothetical protein